MSLNYIIPKCLSDTNMQLSKHLFIIMLCYSKKGIELRSYTKDRYIKHSTTKEVIYFHLMSIEDFLYLKHSAIGYKDNYI